MKPQDEIKKFPAKPGVYLFKDKKGSIIYIGKAKNLKNRVRAYFSGTDDRPAIEFLRRRIKKAEYIVTNTEEEALLLENNLIKENQPKYNVRLKDDKQFLGIRLGMEHKYPRISLVRKSKKDGALYFGPYISGAAVKEILYQITLLLGVRTCTDHEFANRKRACLKWDIGRCLAPCVGETSKEEYEESINAAKLFLEGKHKEVVSTLKKKMKIASDNMDYEKAGKIRDAINTLKGTGKQRVVDYRGGDADYWAIIERNGNQVACLVVVRRGVVRNSRNFKLGKLPMNSDEAMREVLLRYYQGMSDKSFIVFTEPKPKESALLSKILKLKIKTPTKKWRGPMDLAIENANETLDQNKKILERLQKWLRLKNLPKEIEIIDISHLSGENPYGSLVRFSNGKSEKSGYRLFKMKPGLPDDYRMMKELISRRLKRGDLPNLLLIDGGKGQLSVVKKVLDEFEVTNLEIASIAKGKEEGVDTIYRPDWKDGKKGNKRNPEYLLLERMRDEAHRFGITAQRRSRKI